MPNTNALNDPMASLPPGYTIISPDANAAAQPIMPKGKAMVPAKPHEAAVVRNGNWHHHGDEVSRPGGIGALLDLASFD
jgi:hypothetical protein